MLLQNVVVSQSNCNNNDLPLAVKSGIDVALKQAVVVNGEISRIYQVSITDLDQLVVNCAALKHTSNM